MLEEKGSGELPRVGYHSGKRVFTEEQEKQLTEYLLRAADALSRFCNATDKTTVPMELTKTIVIIDQDSSEEEAMQDGSQKKTYFASLVGMKSRTKFHLSTRM
ncbi:unnamed protein product [Leuciscus chuanchicus]